MKKLLAILLAFALLVTALAGCSSGKKDEGASGEQAAATEPAEEKAEEPAEEGEEPAEEAEEAEKETAAINTRINMGTSNSGTLFYQCGVAMTQLWVEKFGATASAVSTGGSKENLQMLESGEINVGFLQSDVLIDSYAGVNEFDGQAHPELRILAAVTTNPYHLLVRKDAGIEDIKDVKGKNCVVGTTGGGVWNMSKAIFGTFGITFDDINTNQVAQGEAIEAMRNGLADFTIVVGQYPYGTIIDALSSDKLGLIGLTEEEQSAVLAENSWMSPECIPAGTYEGIDEDLLTLAHNGYIVVNEDFDEEDAYNLVKSFYENKQWLVDSYAAFDSWAFNNPWSAIEQTGVPLHPGAERAFEELGLK